MTKIVMPALGLAMAFALSAQPALAAKKEKEQPAPPAPAAPAGLGIAVANLNAAVAGSEAFKNAAQQRQTYYKATLDQAEARAKQLDAQLKAMVDKFQADRAAKKPDAVLQQQYQAIQQAEAAGKQNVQQILMPVALSEAYVNEQISDKLDPAVQAAMTKKGVNILLQPGAVVARAGTHELTPAIVAELNTLVPNVQFIAPPGWLPREVREQQAAQQAAQQQAAQPGAAQPAARPVQPAGPQPDGR